MKSNRADCSSFHSLQRKHVPVYICDALTMRTIIRQWMLFFWGLWGSNWNVMNIEQQQPSSCIFQCRVDSSSTSAHSSSYGAGLANQWLAAIQSKTRLLWQDVMLQLSCSQELWCCDAFTMSLGHAHCSRYRPAIEYYTRNYLALWGGLLHREIWWEPLENVFWFLVCQVASASEVRKGVCVLERGFFQHGE